MTGDSEAGGSILSQQIQSGGGEQLGSPWPKRLLIAGFISLVLGTVGMVSSLPDIEEVLRPDGHYILLIEPSSSESLEVTGLNKYVFYQNITENEIEMGTLTILDSEGGEVELLEPTITAAVGTLEFDDGVTYQPLGWIKASENGQLSLSSSSNHSIYVIDQNAVDLRVMQQFDIMASCGALLLGACLLPVAGLLHFLRPKTTLEAPSVTMMTADGRQVSLSIDLPTGTGPVLTTDQVYALTKLREQAADGGEMKVEFLVKEQPQEVPAPFSDRPDQPFDKLPSQVVRPSPNERASVEPVDTASQKTGDPKSEETFKKSWKDWDQG
jgi:hypothetical protein